MSKVIKPHCGEGVEPLGSQEKDFFPLRLVSQAPHSQRKVCADTLRQARQKAQQILKQARQVKSLSRREYEEAKRKGYEEGLREGALVVQRLSHLAQKLDREIEEWKHFRTKQLEEDVLAVIEHVIRKVLQKEFLRDRRILLQWIRSGLERLGPVNWVRIRLNPKDRQAAERLWSSAATPPLVQGNVRWVSDERLAAGSCILETDRGEVDVSLETQEARLFEALRTRA